MGLPVRQQLAYWGLAAAGFLGAVWLLGDVMLPFVIGAAVAYLLDPLADRLERLGMGRALATVTITLSAAALFVAGVLVIVPLLVDQAMALLSIAPEIARQAQAFLTAHMPGVEADGDAVRRSLVRVAEALQSRGGQLLNGVLVSAGNIINLVVVLLLVPVITFYLLLDWDRIVAQVDALLPRDHAPVIRGLAREIDATLAGFLRGQGTVCLTLGIFYAAGLGIVGLQFGLIIGLLAGLISFIPYVGAIVGGALALGLALFQFWGEWGMIAAVGGVFVAGQILEGNVLTPRLVGSSVGLHPVWLIFALSAFGTLFGFVGMLIAVPVAASMGVLARFAIGEYRTSRLYIGHSSTRTDEEQGGQP